MQCGCGQRWEWTEVEEIDETTCLGKGGCPICRVRFGVEGGVKEIAPLLGRTIWTDEAGHVWPFSRSQKTVVRYSGVRKPNGGLKEFRPPSKRWPELSWNERQSIEACLK